MKNLIIIVFILFGIFTIGVNAQTQTGIFGWTQYSCPQFPTNDTIFLTASTDINSFPQITGYNNQNSLEANITFNGSGYSFICKTFDPPLILPQNLKFTVKSTNGEFFAVVPIIEYQGIWYVPLNSNISLPNDWYISTSQEWYDINNGPNLYPNDSLYIETCVLYFYNYSNDLKLTLDTWYYYDGNSPKLIYGFGDVLSGLENIDPQTPSDYSLLQNYPNPFNPSTKIQFTVPTASYVNLDIYNVLGQKVATLVNEELISGTYEYEFNATNLPSGNYFYTLSSGSYKVTKKMVFLK